MALFSYQATDNSGELINGSMEASDKSSLVDKLQEMGYFPIKVGEPGETTSTVEAAAKTSSLHRFFHSRISSRKTLDFTHQLHSMLDAGLSLDKTLTILADLEQDVAFKEVIHDIYKGIRKGDSLADCFAKYPRLFSGAYVSMIKAGEISGALEPILVRLTEYMEKSQRLKENILSALIYPLMLTFVGGGAIVFMLLFVIPKFSLMFSDMGGVLPLSTQILLKLSALVMNYWWLLLAIIIGGVLSARYYINTKAGRFLVDSLKLRIPVFGVLIKKTVSSRFSRMLGTLLHGGTPIIEALNITKGTVGNSAVAVEMDAVIEGVRKGRGIALPLKRCRNFPPLMVHMLTVGEESGKLDEMLIKVADTYDRELNNAIKRLLSLMEPAIILVMAVVVGFIVVSLLLAIFSLNEMPI